MKDKYENPNIVFVDDETSILESLEENFRCLRNQWKMHFFSNPVEALSFMLNEEKSSVVVCDWMMPNMDGTELCERLVEAKKDYPLICFYLILLTGKSTTDDIVSALEFGADDFMAKPCDMRELAARIKVGIRVSRLEQNLRKANMDLKVMATTDLLTSLRNRRRAEQDLDAELSRTERGLQSLGSILIDLDHFKQINDTYGHDVGDQALKEAALAIKSAARDYDSISRWGGEEFLVLCPHINQENLLNVANRIREDIESIAIEMENGDTFSLSASCGVNHCHSANSISSRDFIAGADRALYLAKKNGRNRVEYEKVA